MDFQHRLHYEQQLKLACQQVVNSLQTRPGFSALNTEEFTQRLLSVLKPDPSDLIIEDSEYIMAHLRNQAVGVYSSYLYKIARYGGPDERRQAYEELSAYLYRIAYNQILACGGDPELGKDCTQEALHNIYTHIDQVKDPRSFLKYGLTTVLRECKRAISLKSRTISLDELLDRWQSNGMEAEDGNLVDEYLQVSEVDIFNEIIPLRDVLLRALEAMPNRDWRTLLVLEFFTGSDDQEIAGVLETTKNNIQVMRHRALTWLRRYLILHQGDASS